MPVQAIDEDNDPYGADLPPAVRSAMRIMMQATMRTWTRGEAEAYIRNLRDIIEDERMVHPILIGRGRADAARRRRGQAVAAAWISEALIPFMVAALPPKGKRG